MIQVLLVTQQQCAFCVQAKDLLTRLAREYELSVSTLDVQSPQGEALALHSGLLFPPGIFLDGTLFCYGRPSERKLRQELARRNYSRGESPPCLPPLDERPDAETRG